MSQENEHGNGVKHTQVELVDTVILTYNRATDKLEIGGAFISVDIALDMLGRARRALEFLQRKAQALEIQAAARQQAEDAAVAAAVRKLR